MCNLKTDKQYDTKQELYSHEFIYVTQALLNKMANVYQVLWANETKLWNVRAEILMWAYLTPLLNKRAQRALGRSPEEKVKGQGEAIILI